MSHACCGHVFIVFSYFSFTCCVVLAEAARLRRGSEEEVSTSQCVLEGESRHVRAHMRTCVCWTPCLHSLQLFLEVLPEDRSLWVEYSRKGREEYDRAKKKVGQGWGW